MFQGALCSTLTWAFISSLWWFSSVDCHLYATWKDRFWRLNQYLINFYPFYPILFPLYGLFVMTEGNAPIFNSSIDLFSVVKRSSTTFSDCLKSHTVFWFSDYNCHLLCVYRQLAEEKKTCGWTWKKINKAARPHTAAITQLSGWWSLDVILDLAWVKWLYGEFFYSPS